MDKSRCIFQGSNKKQSENLNNLPDNPPPWRDFRDKRNRGERAKTYQASDHEIEMVNAALLLRRPLLITGPPGVGKSSLAYAVAYELDLGEVLVWPITSKSSLQQGLYSYDALARLQETALHKSRHDSLGHDHRLGHSNLQESQLAEVDSDAKEGAGRDDDHGHSLESTSVPEQLTRDNKQEVLEIGRYIRLGPLGTAFVDSKLKRPRVVLIDEIDKSDIDLPNDLLHLFEEGEFEIQEIARLPQSEKGEDSTIEVFAHGKNKNKLERLSVPRDGIVRCEAFPLVIMTSNGEREFPPAFLRRCLRLHIERPNTEKLQKIVAQHLELEVPDPEEKLELIKEESLTETQREARSILGEFLKIQRAEHREIATDQLLNAIYLIKEGINLSQSDKNELRKGILAVLADT